MSDELKNGRYVEGRGKIIYYKDDLLHREDGPAIEFGNGYKLWFLNGKRHSEYGPAVLYPDGYKEWWIDGKKITEEYFNKWQLNKKLQATLAEKPKTKKVKI